MKIAKTKGILKRRVNKLFIVENTYPDTKQTDKARKQKSCWGTAIIGELIRYEKYLPVLPEF